MQHPTAIPIVIVKYLIMEGHRKAKPPLSHVMKSSFSLPLSSFTRQVVLSVRENTRKCVRVRECPGKVRECPGGQSIGILAATTQPYQHNPSGWVSVGSYKSHLDVLH